MTLRELLDTLKGLGAKLTRHDGDTLTLEPPDVLTPAIRAALAEHQAALVALIRSGPAATSSFDALMTAFDGLSARPLAEVLHERLRTLAAGLTGADPLFRALVRAEAIARLEALGVRAAARGDFAACLLGYKIREQFPDHSLPTLLSSTVGISQFRPCAKSFLCGPRNSRYPYVNKSRTSRTLDSEDSGRGGVTLPAPSALPPPASARTPSPSRGTSSPRW